MLKLTGLHGDDSLSVQLCSLLSSLLPHGPSCVLTPAWSVILLPRLGLIADYDHVFSWSHRLNLVEVMKHSHFSGHAVLSFEPTNDKLEPITDIWYTIW